MAPIRLVRLAVACVCLCAGAAAGCRDELKPVVEGDGAEAGAAGMAGARAGGAGGASGADACANWRDGPPVCGVCGCTELLPERGYIQQWDACGMMGPWYTFGCEGAVFHPVEGESVVAANGAICFDGTVPQVTDGDYETYFGAAVAFDVCTTPDITYILPPPRNTWEPVTKYTAADCNVSLHTISFSLWGTVPAELRVVFKERDREENTYLLVAAAGSFCGMISDARVHYSAAAPPLDASKVEAIHFMVPTSDTVVVGWDFCIRDLVIN